MRLRNQRIKVAPPDLILRQQDDVVVFQVPDTIHRDSALRIEVSERDDVLALHPFEQPEIGHRHTPCPRERAHLVRIRHLQMADKRPEPDLAESREKVAGHRGNIDESPARWLDSIPLAGGQDKVHALIRIIGDQRQTAGELRESPHRVFQIRRRNHHIVGDPHLRLDGERDRPPGIDQRGKLFRQPSAFDLLCSNLDDIVRKRTLTGRHDIEHDTGTVDSSLDGAADQILHVVDQIALHAVDHLEIRVFRNTALPSEALLCLRKRLHDTMVGDGDRFHAEPVGLFDDGGRRSHRVHIRHLRMAVQLDPLHRRVIFPCLAERRNPADAVHALDHHLPVIGVQIHQALDHKTAALPEGRLVFREILLVKP